ncbi:MAG TPA: 3-phosphoshikimate 1-carboxyvinyltransferase [Ktedonobacterales bacterium]
MPSHPTEFASAELPPLIQPPKRVFVGPPAESRATREPRLPGSKYYTLRYLLDALLADGESLIEAPALSDDTAVLVRTIRALGGVAQWEQAVDSSAPRWNLRVTGVNGRPSAPPGGALPMGNAGAVLRLTLGIGALLPEARFETDHPDSLGRRPNADLLDALRRLGIQADAREPGGLLPITLRGGPPRGGAVSVSGLSSSQYLSALLYLGPLLPEGLSITITGGLRSQPLVRATLRALAAAGVTVEAAPDLLSFQIPGGQRYRARRYETPGDSPSAAALIAAAVALGTPLRLGRLSAPDDDVRALVGACGTLGLPVSAQTDAAAQSLALTISAASAGDEASQSVERAAVRRIDGDALIDSVPALVALACLLPGETRFENVATLRLKESDRIDDLCGELTRAGADATPLPDAIIVRGQPGVLSGGATVHAHDDHRVAQALAIVAMRCARGLTIEGADAVAKSYPWFFDDLQRLGATVRALDD